MDKSKVGETEFKVPDFLPPRKKVQLASVDSHQATNVPSSPQSIQPVASTATTEENTSLIGPPVVTDVDKNKNLSDSRTNLDTSLEHMPPPSSHHVSDISVVEELVHNNRTTRSSPESKLDTPFPTLPYTEPHWSGIPTEPYFLSVIKNGIVNEEVDISKKPFHVFGRLPCCDISLEHPSLSRYHAILQYRPQPGDSSLSTGDNPLFSNNATEAGFYVYDLGSIHGTVINKSKVQARCYYRLRVGQMVKFGGSSRMFLLEHGTGNQAEVEADAEAEIKDILDKKEAIERKQADARAAREQLAKERESMGVMWGMLMDDVPGEAIEEEYEIDPEREAFYADDPKKALKNFFHREGLELEYETGEDGPTHSKVHTCRIRLPIDTAIGESLYAEASAPGKKKDAVLECALNACRILDAHDILRQQSQRRKRKERNWEENDYYDSDEDTFLDRTGSIEVKRRHRMKKAGVETESVETYDSLQRKLSEICKEMSSIEKRLERDQQARNVKEDDLDSYMQKVSDQLDTSKRTELKQKLQGLRKEETRVNSLLAIVRPTQMPSKSTSQSNSDSKSSSAGNVKQRRVEDPVRTIAKRPQSKPLSAEDNTEVERNCMEVSLSKPMPDSDSTVHDVVVMKPTSQVLKEVPKLRPGPSLPSKVIDDEQSHSTKSIEDSRLQVGAAKYSGWLPPQHQTGDGRTYLNDKYGY